MDYDAVYIDLLSLLSDVGARPDVPVESENFFSRLVETFDGTREELLAHISNERFNWFECVADRPRWLQEPEWPFHSDHPMTFVGQLDIPRSKRLFSDDAAFFLFWDPDDGHTCTVLQVA